MELQVATRSATSIRVLRLCAALSLIAIAVPSVAQDKAALVRVLNSRGDFRIRVQAAFALGNTRDPSILPHLFLALRDQNPAVRAAAATALGRLGYPEAVRPLRMAKTDSSPTVRAQAVYAITQIENRISGTTTADSSQNVTYPAVRMAPPERVAWGRVRYVVLLGSLQDRSARRGANFTDLLKQEVETNLRQLSGVAVITDASQIDSTAQREIQRRRLPQVRLDGTLTRIERQTGRDKLAVRCEVSLIVLQEPDRVMRGILQGAATSTRMGYLPVGSERRLTEQALAGAVRSAVSGASRAFENVAHSRLAAR